MTPSRIRPVVRGRAYVRGTVTKPKIISLYSGAGGLDYGFESAGFETGVAVEMDHQCCETLRANRDWPVIERDIMEVSSAEILEAAGLKKGEAALLMGGPPCQPFSKAGYWHKGDSLRLDDPRANTLAAYLRVLQDTLPRAFLLENVEGLAYAGKDEGLRLLLDAIETINRKTKSHYRPVFRVLNAADYGVPQIRKRVLMIAARDGSEFQFPVPTHFDASEPLLPGQTPHRTAWDALADVRPAPDEDLGMRGAWADLLPTIPEGSNYLFHTDRGDGLPLFGWRRRYWSFLLKLAKNQPSWTIQAQPGPAIGPFHWESRRRSMRELARLQTFPDDVTITGNRGAVQKQLGNAVPSLLAEVIAREIRAQFLGMKPLRGAPRLLPPDRSPAPPPEPIARVPKKFQKLVGQHEAHPGTGKGYGAIERERERELGA
jgi:DNA (cytosine-5)-methyltransferase 1